MNNNVEMSNSSQNNSKKRGRNWNNNNNSKQHTKRAKLNKRVTFKNKNNVKLFKSNNDRRPIMTNRSNKENMPNIYVKRNAALAKIKEIETHKKNIETLLGQPLKPKKKKV